MNFSKKLKQYYFQTAQIKLYNRIQLASELILLGFMIWMGYSWWQILTMGFLIFIILLMVTIKQTAIGMSLKTVQDAHNRNITRDLLKKMKGIMDDTELPN